MATSIIQNDVFKFVTVRPPQKVPDQKKQQRFIYDNQESPLLIDIQNVIANGGYEPQVLILVQEQIKAHNYSTDFPSFALRKQFTAIDQVITTNLANFDSTAFIKQLEAVLAGPPADFLKRDEIVSLRRYLWESLYAFHILNRKLPFNLENLVWGLRVLQVLDYLAFQNVLVTQDELNVLYHAVPSLPQLVFQIPKAPPSARERTTVVSESSVSDRAKEEQQATYASHVSSLYHAFTELESVSSASPDNYKVIALPAPPLQNENQNGDNNIANQPHAVEAQPAATFVLNDEAIGRLSEETQSVLREAGISLDTVSVSQAIATLERQLGSSVDQLVQLSTIDGRRDLPAEIRAVPGLLPLLRPRMPQIVPQLPPADASIVFPQPGTIRPLGIGDLRVVKQTLQKYAAGEVAHIENVLKSESRDRKHRRLDRTEVTLLIDQETTQESVKDLQTTERFELQRETQNTVQTDMSVQAGLTVSASYGPVQIGAQANFAYNTSSSESTRTATSYAKDVTDRSITKIQQRVRQERIQNTLTEIEETNDHGFDNSHGDGNITGIYRWVDKHYQAQIYNYGKRLLFEFIVPEPAAFYIYSQTNKPDDNSGVPLPSKPQDLGSLTHKDIQPWNYQIYENRYQVTDITTPPPLNKVIGITMNQNASDKQQDYTAVSKELTVPPGYKTTSAYVLPTWTNVNPPMIVNVGTTGNLRFPLTSGTAFITLSNEDAIVPVAVHAVVDAFTVIVEVFCTRRPEALEDWQIKTYASIVSAYQKLLADYNDRLASKLANQGVTIAGRNPAINRIVEQQELKKSCLTMFTNQDFSDFGSVGTGSTFNYPEIYVDAARSQGKYIQFFEQAFEWEQITYLYYPYFWGRKANWLTISNLEDTDPLFTQFLQAGAARVIVPVHLAYEGAVLHYLESNGEIWNGGDPPVLNDPLFESIVDELKSQQE
ncbi:MAG: hypothetical protein ACJ8AG_24565, partial [Ktedonobacteraceae bacterium]